MLPLRNDRFTTFFAPAKSVQSGWFVILGMILIVLFYLEFMYAIVFILSVFIGEGSTLFAKFGYTMRQIGDQNTPFSMVLTLSTFFAMAGAVLLTATVLRDRPAHSLIGKGPVLRNMLTAGGILAVLVLLSTVVLHATYEMKHNMPVRVWLMWLPVALPLLFVQISAEELIFRGYLMQELAARYQNPLIWLFVPALVFGALHWDSDQFGSNAPLVVVGTTLFGLFAADVTARTGNLGAAIGLHFVNNFFALFITSIDGKMTGLSLYLTPFTTTDHDAVRIVLLWDIGLVALAYGVYLAVIRLTRRG